MLRMTGLDMEDLTEIRRLYLRQSIANVSLEDEGYTDMVCCYCCLETPHTPHVFPNPFLMSKARLTSNVRMPGAGGH